uniref:Uncharacterized protein n=1 Tax=Panagrolaimus sp. ES5 TaxID=591445 RepID=A0AC34EZT0_9BILA
MAGANEQNAESIFFNIKKTPKRYSTEIIKNWNVIKPVFMKLMKNYRPIKISDYQYGLSTTRKCNSRLIVCEFNDKTKVREYYQLHGCWYCCECNRESKRGRPRKLKLGKLLIEYGIVFVEKAHHCKSREASIVQRIQSILENDPTKHSNYYRELANPSLELMETNTTNDTLTDETSPETSQTNNITTPTCPTTHPTFKVEEDNDDCVILDVKPQVLNR